MVHRQYSKELFSKMIPLEKHWIGQCSLAAVGRLENVKLMAESGCKGLFIGFESVDEDTVKFTGKRQNKPAKYMETMQMLHEHGIGTWGSFVFGFDTDDPEVFDRTVQAAIDMKLMMALFAILTPYPGTALYKRLLSEGRLTNPTWWLGHDHDAGSPYFLPKRMSREQLREGWARAWTSFYSYESMWKRYTLALPRGDTPGSSWSQVLGYWPINFMQHQLAHRKILGGMQRFRAGAEFGDAALQTMAGAAGVPPLSPTASGFSGVGNVKRTTDGRRALHVVGG
jgi:radical SAM superfamily enzyme YgiQ (UPF0313 family)